MPSTNRIKQLKLHARYGIRRAFFSACLAAPITRLLDRNRLDMPLGPRGELAAERYLLRQGYWIIDRGVGEKTGEIDLIVSDGRSIIFVEVKTRSSDAAGDPTEAVDSEKQHHISQTARLYAVKHRLEETPMRFDVVSIIWPNLNESPQIDHYRNAFEAIGDFQMF